MKKFLQLVALLTILFTVSACTHEGTASAASGYETNVVAYCRAIQSGDYTASLPLTVVGAESLKQIAQRPEFERASRREELLTQQRVDIERFYRRILPPSAQWKILDVDESQVKGTRLVFIEVTYPDRTTADFTEGLDPHTLEQIKHPIKRAIYYATVEQKSKLIVDLPNFRTLALYKTQEMWD